MQGTVTEKILRAHLAEGELRPGEEIGIWIDQCLLQDATGTMAALEFEALGQERIRCPLGVIYIDHNTLQTSFENMDDHLFLQSFALAYGLVFSRPGNGICHQVHLERFVVPGQTLLGSDSHTPTAGGAGMLAIGAGGLDVAAALAGAPFYFRCPEVIGVRLVGRLRPWVSAKDVILEVLRRITVKGGVGKVLEYYGPGLSGLTVWERATIANMGTETGATSSVFPSDELTRDYLRRYAREELWVPLSAEEDAEYCEVVEINLDEVEPLVALPSSPDRVIRVKEAGAPVVGQVNLGSCTNSSYRDLMMAAKILEGKRVAENVSLSITPGSRQVLRLLAENGALSALLAAGARVLETACDGCIGMGSAPGTDVVSVRTYNRNFSGRSGTPNDKVYLVSPETAAATAITGRLTDPRELGLPFPTLSLPQSFPSPDNMLIFPEKKSGGELRRGPNIKPLPRRQAPGDRAEGEVLLKAGDNITTDHIMPGGARFLPLRSNIPALAEHVFSPVDPTFAARAQKAGGGFIAGGENYGQGSSREHAALAPMYLGVIAVLAKSFARIHKANLINFGIIPLELSSEGYDSISQGDRLSLSDLRGALASASCLRVRNETTGQEFEARLSLSTRERQVLLAGGRLNHIRASL